MIELSGLSKSFSGKPVLQEINLFIQEGDRGEGTRFESADSLFKDLGI